MRIETFGDLRVRITGGEDRQGGGDGPAIVLMHGFGAPGDDLVPLARVLDVPRGARFVFPEAPLAVPGYGGGRAWWRLDLARLERLAGGDPTELSREVPAGLAEARAQVDAMRADLDRVLRPSKIVLGGFSQGAMLACDVALHAEPSPAALVMLSGTFIAADVWRSRMKDRAGLPAFVSHGTADPLLPFELTERLHEAMTEAGWSVTWSPFRGGHEIPPSVLDGVGAFLRQHLAVY